MKERVEMAWILDICSSASLCSTWDPCIEPSNKIKLDLKNNLPSESFLYTGRRGLMQDEIVGERKTHIKWINGGIIHILEGNIIMRLTNQSAKFWPNTFISLYLIQENLFVVRGKGQARKI